MTAVPALLLLEKYQLDERLGPPGAIETHGAVMNVNGESRPCIVKWLHADRIPSESYPSLSARFMAAGHRLLDRHDPGWPVVFDVTQNEHGVFLIREFVVSVDLNGLLQAARDKNPTATLAPAVASLVASKLAQVLAKAHQAEPPLCHLGLAPANVLVTPDGRVLVADFGLFASVRGLIEHGLERWSFVAPELIGCDLEDLPPAAGIAADLYSLGGLLFYLLSGRPPVQARSLTELAERVWEPLAALPGVPEHINAAIAALTAPDPHNRCKSAEEALGLLAPPLESKPAPLATSRTDEGLPFVHKPAPSPAPRPSDTRKARPLRKASRSRTPRAVLLAGSLLLLAGGAALLLHSVHIRPSQAPAARLSPETTPQGSGTEETGNDSPVISKERRKKMLVPGRLSVATIPPNADLWVDGEWQGKTPLDVAPGPGAHRVVIIAPGHLVFKGVYDTTDGEIIRRALDPIEAPARGQAYLDIQCKSEGRFPVFIDGLDTGLLCPAKMVPVFSGRREVAIFVPVLQDSVVQVVTVPPGSKPRAIRFPQ